MAIIKAVRSGASLKRTIDYVSRQNKLDNFLMDGIDCNAQTASLEMLYIRDKFGKHNGVQCIHLVYSLSAEEAENVGLARVMNNARELAENTPNFKDHQILICGHNDKMHKHAHIVVNAVNYKTGQKVRWYKYDLNKFKERLIKQSKDQGLIVPVKGQTNSIGGQKMEIQKVMEKAVKGKYNSWVLDIYAKVTEAKEIAVGKENFIDLLNKQGIQVDWNNRQTITFTDAGGHKIRDRRLNDIFNTNFNKESLENEFKRTAQRVASTVGLERKVYAGTGAERSVTRANQQPESEDLTAFIRKARSEIADARAAERTSAKERNDKITERANRDAARGGQNFGGKQRPTKESGLCRGRSSKEDFSR